MKLSIIAIMLLLCMPIAFASVSYTLTAPANLAEQTSTSMLFNWTPTLSVGATGGGMTTWLFLSAVNNNTPVYNTSATVTNATWRNVTVTGLSVGFYKWYLVTNDSTGNTTSASRWFEIKDTDNQTDFRWTNTAGTVAMRLNRDTGDLDLTGSMDITSNLIVRKNLTVLGTEIVANVTTMSVNGSVNPGINSTFGLGTSSLYWLNLYTTNLYATNLEKNLDATGFNITSAAFISATNLSGALIWSDLHTYPAACPANSAVTTVNDSITCTDGLYTLAEQVANHGNWSADKSSYLALAGGTMTGNIVMNSKNVTGITYLNATNQDLGGQLNMTGSNQVIWFANNASITTNTTCLILRSPDGTGVMNVCNT
ncbi:MAG: hypothetical protein WC444_06830 [Candidatus Paceibacterota bacterium]